MKSVYMGNWSNSEGMLGDFNADASVLEGYNVVVAIYEYGHYDGTAFVLLEKDGNYFEVNGSHCSCYGLEGQWSLEESAELALKHRYEKGDGYGCFGSVSDVLKEHFGW